MKRRTNKNCCHRPIAEVSVLDDCCRVRERKKGRRSGRGQSMVEISIILPLLLFITLGTVDLGRMFFGYIQMTNAVREGTSIASHEPGEWSEITAAIANHSSNLPAGYSLSCPACSDTTTAGQDVTITATWVFEPITFDFLNGFWGLDPITMSTHSTMKVL